MKDKHGHMDTFSTILLIFVLGAFIYYVSGLFSLLLAIGVTIGVIILVSLIMFIFKKAKNEK